jgi:hypothetical protein
VVAVGTHGEGHPLFDEVLAGEHFGHDVVEVLLLGFGEEADAAQVHAEQRRPGAADQVGGPEQRAVAADDEHQLDAVACVDVLDRDDGVAVEVGRLRLE